MRIMKLSIKQYQMILLFAGAVILALLCLQFEIDNIVQASFEGEKSEDEVWTNLGVEYRYSMDVPMAIVTVDFHNNKMFEICDDFFPDDPYYRTFNFTSFDFRLRSVEETSAYPAGLRAYSEENVELPFGESYNVRFYLRDDLVEGEPIKVEFTARGYNKEDGTRATLEEKLSFTLEPPIYSEPEETPGFEAVFAIASILLVIFIAKKE